MLLVIKHTQLFQYICPYNWAHLAVLRWNLPNIDRHSAIDFVNIPIGISENQNITILISKSVCYFNMYVYNGRGLVVVGFITTYAISAYHR